jgi:hypothetical protein
VKPPAKPPAKPPVKPKPKPVAADYGYVKAFLDAHPDVAAKVTAALKAGWTSARLEAEIKNTDWWKKRTDSQRKWDVISTNNPAEAERQVSARRGELATQAKSMGVTLTPQELETIARNSIINGSTGGEVQSMLAGQYEVTAGKAATGTAGTSVDQIRALGQSYGIKISPASETAYVRDILAGRSTVQALTDTMREQAKLLYPGIAKGLDNGSTVADYLNPYLQGAASELGVNPATFDMTDTKWTAALQGTNGTPMSLDQWTQRIRTDVRYGFDQSPNGRKAGADLALGLGRMFGNVG